jgi:predicted DNA-binding transcriptional regulator AlpA
MPIDQPEILTERQLARLLGLGEATVYRLRHEGTGPAFVQLSARRVGYRRSAVEAWLKARERAPSSGVDHLVREPVMPTPFSPNTVVVNAKSLRRSA